MDQLLLGRKHYHILRLFNQKDNTDEGVHNGFVTAKEIISSLSKKYGKSTLYKDLYKLQDLGLIKRVKHTEDGKHYYYLSSSGESIVTKGSSRHSFLLSKVTKDLVSTFARVKSHFSPEEISCTELGLDTNYINPDSVLKIESRDKKMTNCAFELELTQKSASRIRDKFEKYIEDNYFHSCLYLFEFERDFDKYTYIFEEFVNRMKDEALSKKAHTKFVFVFNESLESPSLSLLNSKTFFNKKIMTLQNLFEGAKKQ